jgi:hypothetical protein
MLRAAVVASLACGACGRVAFDAVPGASDGASGDGTGGPRPVAWWKLDETSGTLAADSAGTSDGTLKMSTGALTWQAVSGGPVARALGFDGTGGGAYVDIGSPPAITNLPAVTIVAWIRPTTTPQPTGNSNCFFDKANIAPVGGYSMDHSVDLAGDLVFDAEFTATASVHRSSTGGVLSPGVWARVAATWDGSPLAANVHLYVDGVETSYDQSNDAIGSPPRPSDSPIGAVLGCNASSGFAGLVADLRLYDVVLTSAQLAAL